MLARKLRLLESRFGTVSLEVGAGLREALRIESDAGMMMEATGMSLKYIVSLGRLWSHNR